MGGAGARRDRRRRDLRVVSAASRTVGRRALIAELAGLLGDSGTVLLTGAAGVGKTHVARAVLAELASRGAQVEQTVGGTVPSSVPLGPLAHLVPPLAGSVPLVGLIAATMDTFRLRSETGLVVLLADDVDLLDSASATVVSHLAGTDDVAVIATARDAGRAAGGLGPRWSRSATRIISVEPLLPADTAELAAAVAGGELEPESNGRVYHLTGGNPLWVTELVRAARLHGALTPGRGGLHVDTRAAAGRLSDLLAVRLAELSETERDGLRLLGAGGALPLSLLEAIVGPEVPRALAGAGLIVVGEATGSMALPGTAIARFAHPLHRQLVRSALDPLERQALLRRLLDAAGAAVRPSSSGPATPGERALLIRVGLWHAELGEHFDPEALGWAAQEVQWGLLDLMRRHSADPGTVGATGEGVAAELGTAEDRADAALQLATGAWRQQPTFANGLALARLIMLRPEQAARMVAICDALRDLAHTEEERAWLAVVHGIWLYWSANDRSRADEELRRAEASLHLPWRGVVSSTRAGLTVQTGAIDAGLRALREEAPAPDAPSVVTVTHLSPLAAALLSDGHLHEAVETAERGLALASRLGGDAMLTTAELLISQHWGRLCLSRYAEVGRDAHRLVDLLAATSEDEGRALFSGMEARCLLLQGNPARAARLLEEAIRGHGPITVLGFRALLHSTLAVAAAWLGRLDDARREVREARRWAQPPRFFDAEIDTASALVLAADGQRSRAVSVAAGAGRQAAALGGWYYAFHAWLLAVRLRPSASNRASLSAAAQRVDGPLPSLAVAYGDALHARDPLALERLSAETVDAGEVLLGLEMLEAAAASAVRSRAVAFRLGTQVERLRRECEGARSPVVELSTDPSGLTARELEIATLAARGWSSPAIADELVLSVRTVESHLYRAYAKLGVRSREELAGRLQARSADRPKPAGFFPAKHV